MIASKAGEEQRVEPGAVGGLLLGPRTPLIGRNQDLAAIHDLIVDSSERLVTLTGLGGCGKTRLAVQLAADLAPTFPQRVWLVDLATLADPALVPNAVAAALGVRETAASSVADAIPAALCTQPSLLVLDNCEHLIDTCATFADHLLSTCPTLRILATSREPLQIGDERQYRVSPLELPSPDQLANVDAVTRSPAVQLFIDRAQAIAADFHVTGANAETVAQICSRLDGIPLALELAAARVRVLSLEQILARLDESFRLLVGGSRVAPTRQQTLRATFDWSDALLSTDERLLFRRLAVFSGEFHLDAVESVCSDGLPESDLLEILTRLVDKSLVMVTQDEQSAWYRLLEPVRQYALQGLTASGEMATTQARHANYYMLLAEQAMPDLYGSVDIAWLERLAREQGNLRAALRWAHSAEEWTLGIRLATALVTFWEVHSHLAEGRGSLETALAAPANAVSPTSRMRALVGAGRLSHLHGAYNEAERLHVESLSLARELDDRHGVAMALTELGMATRRQRDYSRSLRYIEEGLALHRELGDEPGIAVALLNLGATLNDQDGALSPAIEHLGDALVRFEKLGDRRHSALAETLLGIVLCEGGELERATQLLTSSLAVHAQFGSRWFVAYSLMGLVRVQMAGGQWEAAARLLGAAQAIGDLVSSRIMLNSDDEDLSVAIRSHLDAERFSAALAEGLALTVEQSVAFALELATPTNPEPIAELPAPPIAVLLTRREREVAELTARGFTDRQIADALFITPGTVGVHVHNILGKLGLYSRVQVADWLSEHPPSDQGGD